MIPFLRWPKHPLLLLLFLAVLVLGTLELLLVRSPAVPPEYVGTWVAGPTRLEIQADGIMTRRTSEYPVTRSVGGRLTKVGPDELAYRVLFIPRHLPIQAPPHLEGDVWVMTVDGHEYWRIP